MVWTAGLAVVLKMLHAYVRCSSVEQNPQLQIDAASRLGVDRIWSERRSSAVHRPELVRLLYSLRRGDTLIAWRGHCLNCSRYSRACSGWGLLCGPLLSR